MSISYCIGFEWSSDNQNYLFLPSSFFFQVSFSTSLLSQPHALLKRVLFSLQSCMPWYNRPPLFFLSFPLVEAIAFFSPLTPSRTQSSCFLDSLIPCDVVYTWRQLFSPKASHLWGSHSSPDNIPKVFSPEGIAMLDKDDFGFYLQIGKRLKSTQCAFLFVTWFDWLVQGNHIFIRKILTIH